MCLLSHKFLHVAENTGQLDLNSGIGSYIPLALQKAASKKEESLTSDRIQDIDSLLVEPYVACFTEQLAVDTMKG